MPLAQCNLYVLNLSMVGYFGIGCAQIIDGQFVNIIITGQSGKIFELFSGNPQKVFKFFGGLVYVQATAQGWILGGDSHGAFACVAYPVLLATDGDQR